MVSASWLERVIRGIYRNRGGCVRSNFHLECPSRNRCAAGRKRSSVVGGVVASNSRNGVGTGSC